jgi:hypothetical protein
MLRVPAQNVTAKSYQINLADPSNWALSVTSWLKTVTNYLLIGLLVLEFGVECGPDLRLCEGVVVNCKIGRPLDDLRQLRAINTLFSSCGRGGRRGPDAGIHRGGRVAPGHPQLCRPRSHPRLGRRGKGQPIDGRGDLRGGRGGGRRR